MGERVESRKTDGDLIEAFLERREQGAFEEIVRRYEPLVRTVCLRVLNHEEAARDAGQAVFLTLALKAGVLDRRRPLGPWLHRVAWDIAVSQRRAGQARRARERTAIERLRTAAPSPLEEVLPILDEEINGLPERYRRALILFHLEGRTLEETAAVLGRSIGTVGAWLFRGRRLLRDRLARRGVTPALFPAVLETLSPPPGAEAALRVWTAKAALAALAGHPAAGGFVSNTVWTLARRAASPRFFAPIASAAGGAVVAALLWAAAGTSPRIPPPHAPIAPMPPAAPTPPPVFAARPPSAAPGIPSATEISFPAAAPRRSAAPEAPPPMPGPRRSDLVAHWPLDGPREDGWVEDRSGRGHRGRIVGPVFWTAGKIGRALILDGRGSYIEPAVSPDLEGVHRSSFSLAAWFRPADIPPGRDAEARASYGILLRTGWHIGLLFNHEGRFLMTDWLRGETGPVWNTAGTWETTHAAGHWYHLAGVVDRGLGRVSLYVNGILRHTQAFDPSREVFEVPEGRWRIGIGNPHWKEWSWPAKGAIDDVRLYNRPLSPTDVRLILAETAEE